MGADIAARAVPQIHHANQLEAQVSDRKPLPANITTRSAFTLNLANVGCGKALSSEPPMKITDPADRARLSADLAGIKQRLNQHVVRHADGSVTLRAYSSTQAYELEELQKLAVEIERLLS